MMTILIYKHSNVVEPSRNDMSSNHFKSVYVCESNIILKIKQLQKERRKSIKYLWKINKPKFHQLNQEKSIERICVNFTNFW